MALQGPPSAPHHQPMPSQAAPPPTRAEIQRRLSTRSSYSKPKPPPVAGPVTSGNESDSSVASSSLPPPLASASGPAQYATSPSLTSPTIPPGQGAGLSAIAEAERQGSSGDMVADIPNDLDLEDGDDSEDGAEEGQHDGMQGQRSYKSGFLIKKQERRKTWKKKWFVLRSTSIAYYKDNREYTLQRSIDLRTVHSVVPVTQEKAKHPFSFAIVTADRTFFVEALSAEEREDWVRAINNVRKQMTDKEEDTRRRDKAVNVPAPARPQQHELEIDTHPGTWASTFSTGTTASASSPTGGSYFHRHAPSQSSFAPPAPIGQQAARSHSPSSNPSNTLSTQVANMSVARSPSQKTAMPPPSAGAPSAASINRRLSNPIIHPPPELASIRTPVRAHLPRRESQAQAQAAADASALGPPQSTPQFVSSDEEEPYFSDPSQAYWSEGQQAIPHPVSDPNKIIVAAYLMKKSRKTTREVWRKRWFYLTSGGMTYSKSHMDPRPLTFVPITTILDVFSIEDTDDVEIDVSSDDSRPAAQPTRGTSMRRQREAAQHATMQDQHIIRIVTNKRRFDLCAPSEEEEIKWIAAIRALVNRDREKRQPGSATGVGGSGGSTPLGSAQAKINAMPAPLTIPTIAQQPPTPGSVQTGPVSPTNTSPPKAYGEQQQAYTPTHGRSRSATQTAKNAVADVVRRFQEGQ